MRTSSQDWPLTGGQRCESDTVWRSHGSIRGHLTSACQRSCSVPRPLLASPWSQCLQTRVSRYNYTQHCQTGTQSSWKCSSSWQYIIPNKFHNYASSNVLLTSTFRPPSAAFFRNWMFSGHCSWTNVKHKSAITDHADRHNCVLDWERAKVVDKETNRSARWIKEAIWIRKTEPTMNRHEGATD